MFYLATKCLINYLYSKMCNFKFINYCKGIVQFQSHCVIILLLSEINCVNVNEKLSPHKAKL